jgi:radical SAM protein with 4Fe4S-binding SPASM domain
MTSERRPVLRPPVGAIPRRELERPNELVRGAAVGPDASISYVVWEITLKCDLGCRHCGSRAGKARSDELSTEECLDVVRQLDELGVREVTLIGGEAYLREDWDVIAKAIVDRGMLCGITTGGRNLDGDRVKRAVDAGVATISVSIDGLERTHDLQRGARGSWRAAIESAERIAMTKMRLATNTQINRLSMPELGALADLLGDVGSKAWQLQLTVPMGRAADRPELLLQPYDLLELFPLLVWIKQEKLTPRGIRVFPGNNIGYYTHYEELLRYGGEGGTHWAGCGAGTSCVGIEADGKIKGCPSLTSETWTGGRSRERSVREIVEGTDELTRIGQRKKDDLWGFCGTCYYADICKAGCTWTSEVLMGRPGNNPYCIHRQLSHERDGMRERLVKVEAAPGRPFDHGRFETVLEPIGEPDQEPTILGVDLARVMSLRPTDPGVFDEAEGKRRLRIL